MNHPTTQTKSGKYLRQRTQRPLLAALPFFLILLFCSLCFFCGSWYLRIYGDTGFDAVLYTLTSSLSGVQSDLKIRFLLGGILPALLLTVRRRLKLMRWSVVALSLVMLVYAAFSTGFVRYVIGRFQETPLFENYYVEPTPDKIKFPEKKRNLVYIYLESMEISYLSKELGGAQDVNLIPELYDLAKENTNFSHNDTVGGFSQVPGV